jgi:molybdate transport system permease protein
LNAVDADWATDLQAVGLTLKLAFVVTVLLLAFGTPLAWWLAQTRSRWKAPLSAVVALPLVLPPTVLGFYLLVGLGPTTALGRTLITLIGHPLAFTFSGLLIGSMIYSLPFAVQPLVVAFSSIDRPTLEVAAVLGASPLTVFRRITLPLSRMSFITAAVLTFAHTVGEFGIVLMVGGDIPGITRTLSISIFDQVQELRYTDANLTAAALVALSFLALLVVYSRGNRRSELV